MSALSRAVTALKVRWYSVSYIASHSPLYKIVTFGAGTTSMPPASASVIPRCRLHRHARHVLIKPLALSHARFFHQAPSHPKCWQSTRQPSRYHPPPCIQNPILVTNSQPTSMCWKKGMEKWVPCKVCSAKAPQHVHLKPKFCLCFLKMTLRRMFPSYLSL